MSAVKKKKGTISDTLAVLTRKMQRSPVFFVQEMFGLTLQKVKPEYRERLAQIVRMTWTDWEKGKQEICADWFGTRDPKTGRYVWHDFQRDKHMTWQQWLILMSFQKAIRKEAPVKISVASGHGLGKTSSIAWLVTWFLYCFPDAQVPCTAPTADQMYDILWKELNKWINRLPGGVIRSKFIWESSHIRISESPETWFARAKTASKENTEALAGVHGDYVLLIADEASGVFEQVFNTAEGAMTSGTVLFGMISNPTRTIGYFYDSHHKDREQYQCLQFDCRESPIVDWEYVERMATKHGVDSDEFGIRVKGTFPREDMQDDKGYVPLLVESSIRMTLVPEFVGVRSLGVDPAGEGKDKTVWVVRDQFKARKVAEELKSTPKSVAARTITLMDFFGIPPHMVAIDSFGEGADVAKEIAIATQGKYDVKTFNVGHESDEVEEDHNGDEKKLFLNLRAEAYWKSKLWLQTMGEIFADKLFKEELLNNRFRRTESGKIQMMPKKEMRKLGIKSPNAADAFSLTFLVDFVIGQSEEELEAIKAHDDATEPFNPYSAL